jgi:glycosyltransferase involved in cell wall biosynthesis
MSALRVLMVSDVSPLTGEGGAERVLWEHARGLADRGHAVTVLGRAPAGVTARTEERAGVRVVLFGAGRTNGAGFVRDAVFAARHVARELLAGDSIDVLNVYQPLAGWGVLRLPCARRLPTLYSFLSPAPLEYRSREATTRHHVGGVTGRLGAAALWTIERSCLRRADRIHVLSDYSAAQLRDLYRIAGERVVKIPGGADLTRFRPAENRADVRAQLGLPKEAPVLLTVRNLEERMGLDTLLRAMPRVLARHPETRLLVGGAGSLRNRLETLAAELGVLSHVRFLGFVPDEHLPLYYQAADGFVLPTRELEGFGLVTVEALACGTPVLGTPVGATPELLEPIEPTLVFEAATAEAIGARLVAFVEQLERDPAALERMRERAREHAELLFGWSRTVASLEAELRGLVGARAPWHALTSAAIGTAARPARDAALRARPTPAACPDAALETLHVITRLTLGGSAENTIATMVALAGAGYPGALAVGVAESDAPSVEDARRRGVTVLDVPALGREVGPSDVAALLYLFRLMRARRPAIVHTHTSKAGFLGRLAARLAGVPAIIHQPHGHIFYAYYGVQRTAFYITLERLAAQWTDRIVTLTERGTEEHLARGIGRRAQYRTVPSGVPTAELRAAAPARRAARSRLGLPSDAFVVIGLGRLVPVKGFDVLIAALPSIAAAVPSARVVLVGDGPLRRDLERAAGALGVRDRVLITGATSDIAGCLAAADVLAAPSRNEGMGRAIVEGMALGLPVVAAEVGGIPAVVAPGETGWLVPPDDAAALAAALIELASDEPLRIKLGAAAAQRAEAFSTTVAHTAMRVVYDELAGAPRVAARVHASCAAVRA